jgi:predicted RNA-binding Zn-ribbon protein involved in translation (DUF1610 family)
MNVEVTYYRSGRKSHSLNFEYSRCEWYCPNCGKQEVWEEAGPGDFYEREDYVCLGCEIHFTLPRTDDITIDEKDPFRQILEALRGAA